MIALTEVTRKNFPGFQHALLSIEKTSFLSPWDVKGFASEIDRDVSHLWVLTVEDVVTGYICFWIFAEEVHLLNVAVHEGWRRRGMGQRLLCKMMDTGIERGAESAWLEVRPSNTAARSLYRRIGFEEVGRRLRYYTDTGEDAIIMTLPLK